MAKDYEAVLAKIGQSYEPGDRDDHVTRRVAALKALHPASLTATPVSADVAWRPTDGDADVGTVIATLERGVYGIQCTFCKTCSDEELGTSHRCRCKDAWYVIGTPGARACRRSGQ